MKRFSTYLLFILLVLVPSFLWATDNCANLPSSAVLSWNGLDKTPSMGWISYYPFGTTPTEAEVKAQADLLVSTGLKAAGYSVVEIDDGWAGGRTSGTIYANTTNFPDGMAATITYIHADGLKAGLYSSPYTTTCGSFTGSGTYESADASTFASWGVDLLRYDGCSVPVLYSSCWTTESHQVWQMMAQDIRAAGRPMILYMGTNYDSGGSTKKFSGNLLWASKSGYNEVYAPGVDLNGAWDNLTGSLLPVAPSFYKFEKPGFFPDCDALFGQTEGTAFSTFTAQQSQTQMGLYALWGCPLRLGMDLSTLGSPELAVYKNAGVIAVDQDALAHAAILYRSYTCGTGLCQVWVKQLSGGNWAVGYLNTDTAAHTIAMNFAPFGGSPDVYDLWASSDLGTMSSYSVSVPSDGLAMLKLTPASTAAHQISYTQLINMAIH